MGQEGADIPTFFTLHSETNEIPPRRTDVQNLLPPPPRPQLRIFSPMLNTFLLLISPPMYPLFSPSTPTWLDSTALLHLQFPYFSHSITPVPPISISLFLSAFHPILCLPPTCLSLSLKVCHWKFRHEKKKKNSFSIKLSCFSSVSLSALLPTSSVSSTASLLVLDLPQLPGKRLQPSSPPSFSIPSYPFPPDLVVYPLVQWCEGHEQSAKRCLLQLTHDGNITGGDIFHGLCAACLY